MSQLHAAYLRSVCPRSIKFSLPQRHARDKLSQAFSRFSVLLATKSWAGPGNKARGVPPQHQAVAGPLCIGTGQSGPSACVGSGGMFLEV